MCILLGRRAGVLDEEGSPIGLVPRIVGYWYWLAVEIGKANIAVARQVLAVTPKLSPKIVRVPMPPRTNAGRATFANSITLTPGTVSIDVSENEIVVHALTEELADIAAMTVMGERVARVEGRPR
jgi:multicomponent Na+:H+ antiporter subunit E